MLLFGGVIVNVGLGWLGVGVGAFGCVAMYLMAGGAPRGDASSDRQIAWRSVCATLIATLVLWSVAMLSRTPFSPGQGLAFGFLIGGVTGAAAILLSFRLSRVTAIQESIRSSRLATLSNIFLALFSVSIAYSLFASNPWEPLMGFAMGAAMAAILHSYMQRTTLSELAISTETWALFSITIAAGVLLAMRHFDLTTQRMWWPVPILIAASLAVADYIGIELASLGSLRDKPGKSLFVAGLIATVLVGGLTAIYSFSIFHAWELLEVVGVGLIIGGVICLLLWTLARASGAADGLEAGAACVLMVVAFVTVAFKLWAGLGIGLGLLGIWAIAIPGLAGTRRISDDERASFANSLSLPLIFGLVVLLFKLFLENYHHDLRMTDIQTHYTFIGALLGATLPFLFCAGLIRLRNARATKLIIGVGMMGVAAAAAPLLLLVLWGIKAALGFSFGLTAAMAFMTYARLANGDDRYSAGLLAVASQLTAIQFVGPIMALEMTRGIRIIVLTVAVVALVIWLGLGALFAARENR